MPDRSGAGKSKAGRAKPRGGVKKPTKAKKVEKTQLPAHKLQSDGEEDAEMVVLRAFDLETKYGPCCGMTRSERWERASKLGLEPPRVVQEILQKYGDQDSIAQCLWSGRI
eukprot:evm.model.scf_1557.1 EVM.evm.TU.scf_1557.1   scf_1557:21635-24889(+)